MLPPINTPRELPPINTPRESVAHDPNEGFDKSRAREAGRVTKPLGRMMMGAHVRTSAGADSNLSEVVTASARGPSIRQPPENSGAIAEHLRRQISQLHEERNESQKELESLRTRTKEQALRLEKLEGEASSAKLASQRQQERLQEAEMEQRATRRKLEDMEGEADSAKLSSQRKQERVQQAELEQRAARQKLEEVEIAHKELQGVLSQRDADVDRLQEALAAEQRQSQLKARILEASLKGSKEMSLLNVQFLEAQAKSERQAGELEDLWGRLRQTEQEGISEARRLTAEVDALRKEVEALKFENAALRDVRGTLQEEREALLGEREALSAKLQDALRLRETEARVSKAALEESQKLAEEQRVEAEWQAAQADASKRLFADLAQQSRQLGTEWATASGQCDTLRGEGAVLRGQLEKITEQLEEQRLVADRQRGKLQREVELLRGQLLERTQEDYQLRHRTERDTQRLLDTKIADVIDQKVELHICVPRTSLKYNNTPTLTANVADGLGKERIGQFLEREVFPHFEPLWARLDTMDCGPDGSSKRMYSKRMLDHLTDSVRAHIQKSQ